MNIFKITGKFLDQPILVAKIEKKIPHILIMGGSAYTAYATYKTPEEKRSKAFQKHGMTMFFTVLSALIAPKIANKVFGKKTLSLKEIYKQNEILIDELKSKKTFDTKTDKILTKAKTKYLNFKEIKTLYANKEINKDFLNKLIPEPENITSKEIFSEIGRLSLLGLIPVIGGITGGIFGDFTTTENWKDKIPNKIKEGVYQYLANIFLCNIGAGAALGIMEKINIKNKSARALGMISGIISTGVIGGSAIANMISNKFINPLFGKEKTQGIYTERRPEALDIGLHTDDIATVAVMSGLKWIEPALPLMYSISGYRAGIGYRNVTNCNKTM